MDTLVFFCGQRYAHGIAFEDVKSDVGLCYTRLNCPTVFTCSYSLSPYYFATDHDLSTAYCARYFRLFAIQVALHFFQEVSKGEVAVAGKKTRSSGLR